MSRPKAKLIKCSRCKRRMRRASSDWLVQVQEDDNAIVGYTCPDCVDPKERARSTEWPPVIVLTRNSGRGAERHGALEVLY